MRGRDDFDDVAGLIYETALDSEVLPRRFRAITGHGRVPCELVPVRQPKTARVLGDVGVGPRRPD